MKSNDKEDIHQPSRLIPTHSGMRLVLLISLVFTIHLYLHIQHWYFQICTNLVLFLLHSVVIVFPFALLLVR